MSIVYQLYFVLLDLRPTLFALATSFRRPGVFALELRQLLLGQRSVFLLDPFVCKIQAKSAFPAPTLSIRPIPRG